MKQVTVVLNGFKRQRTLAQQIESLKKQTYPVARIMYFNLKSDDPQFIPDYEMMDREGVEYATASHDYGVWGRFTFALNTTTDFVCIMDDDIIPGRKYIESCVKSYEKCPGIYGPMGSVFNAKMDGLINYGWKGINNNEPVRVNHLYQSWFMPRAALHAFWSKIVPEDLTNNRHIGEDMTVSLMAKKVLGLNTYVAPHPADDMELWGNTTGDEYGLDEYAVHLNKEMQVAMTKFHTYAFNTGLEVISEGRLVNIVLRARSFINRALSRA